MPIMQPAKLPDGYHEALAREVKFSPLQTRPAQGRRSITNENWHAIDPRTEYEKVTDKALVETGRAIEVAQEAGIMSKDDMIKAVRIAYGANRKLTDDQVNAVAVLAWELGLSPNPALGHIYMFDGKYDPETKKKQSVVMVGIYGKINLARRDHRFILREARPMTEDELRREEYEAGDVGVAVGIIDMREAEDYIKLLNAGLKGDINDLVHWHYGRWRRVAGTKQNGDTFSDPIPNAKTKFWLAQKRATDQALKSLGLNSNVGKTPELPGYTYSEAEGGYVTEIEVTEPEPPKPNYSLVLEGEYKQQLADEAAHEESDLAEPADTPDHVTEIKTEIVDAGAGEVVTPAPVETPAPRTARHIFDQIKAKAEKLAMGENEELDGDAIRKLIIEINKGDGQHVRHYVLEQVFGVKSTNDLKAHEFWALDAWARGKTFKSDVDIIQQHIADNPAPASETNQEIAENG